MGVFSMNLKFERSSCTDAKRVLVGVCAVLANADGWELQLPPTNKAGLGSADSNNLQAKITCWVHAAKCDVCAEYGYSLGTQLQWCLILPGSEASFLFHIGNPSRQNYGNLQSGCSVSFRVRLVVGGLIFSERLQVSFSWLAHTLSLGT